MEIIPAIDLRGDRLYGCYGVNISRKPFTLIIPRSLHARRRGGARIIHIVDLDGARDGSICNKQALQSIVENVNIRTELGGGLRDMVSIEIVLDERENRSCHPGQYPAGKT